MIKGGFFMRFKRKDFSYDFDIDGNIKTYDLEDVINAHSDEYDYGGRGQLEELSHKIGHVESLLIALIEIMPLKAKIRFAENLGFSYIEGSEND